MGGVCSNTLYSVHCTHLKFRVCSLCELMFHFLRRVNFQLEYDVFNCRKANYFIVSIFGWLTFSFIYYTTLFCSVVHCSLFIILRIIFSQFDNKIVRLWNIINWEYQNWIMWMRMIAQMAWITLFQQLIKCILWIL